MNNKMFLNKEASFLAHTKRKRRFAVTLVGVFFMLLACAGAIGFGQVAYAADEKTVPSHSSPSPEFPWYGYDAYSGWKPRYHDLKVNLKGSKEYQVYCFNLNKSFPYKVNSSVKKWYKRHEGNEEVFKKFADRIKNEPDVSRKILSVIYNGYSSDANGIMKGLDRYNAILVTQNAIWYYSDNAPLNDVNKMWDREVKDGDISLEQVKLMRDALKKLIDPNLEATAVNKIPSGYRLNIFESENEAYQNLLSAEYVPDNPPKPGETSEHNPKTPELDGTPIPEDPKRPDESSEPALPPLMPELDGQEVPEKPSIDLPIEVPRYAFNNKHQSPLAGESGETEYITEVYGNQQNPVDIDKKLPNETGFSGNMVETEDTKEPEVLMGGQSESVEFTKDTQTGMSGQTTPQVETEDTKEPGVLMGGQSESVEFTKDTQTGMSGQTTPQVETEDTKEPGVLMGGQSESVEFTKDTQTGMSGFSETVTIVEDTRPKLVFHFDNNEPKVEENREKPTKNITPILPATGDIENVLAFLGILILSVLSIFSLLKNKQNNKV
ncbi:fibronectin-binding protein PrtF1/SfbI [Streptococcus pyogenes]|uniref:fibronectin-binding protein PrtF1/SfbI n=1 Tax=Streptococcus pyogenes TaxID=1314 RepID=UPI0010A14301|nr:fibronectin-binding protein PrtF1/SfbI [Streptococcus pyogenes]VGV25741.1 fibronectin-binding protein [Streptococcus pyogenes]